MKAIKFTRKLKRETKKIMIGNTPLNWSREVKYLGITIDEKLKFTTHPKNFVHKVKGAKFKLYLLLIPRSLFSLKTKLYFYKTYMRPILLYGGPIWSPNLPKTYWKKQEVFQLKTLRMLTDAHYYISNKKISNSLHITTIKEQIINYATTLTIIVKINNNNSYF